MMDKKILKALKGSIRKWEKILAGKEEDRQADNCPLCQLMKQHYLGVCDYCPVCIETGEEDCDDTPYKVWYAHQSEKHTDQAGYKVHCDKCKELAQDEVNFLKSLLPKKGDKL